MGLASKLQAAQAAMNTLGPMAGMPMMTGQQQQHHMGGMMPSAPPYPPAGSAPYAPAGAASPNPPAGQGAPAAYPSPYPQPGTIPAGYPQAVPPGGAGTPRPGYPSPSPYPPGAIPGQQQQVPGQQMMPGGAPAPYPAQQPPQQQQQYPQQGPYAAATPGMAPTAGAPGGMLGSIQAKLSSIVAANQLQRFYPPPALAALASRLDGRVNFRELASRWGMPVELALDLAALALYDIVIVADDSGSMAFEEGGERIEDLKMIAQKVSEVATLFDDDGILVRFMNSPVEGNSVRSPADVGSLLAQVQYSGLTPLATSLRDKVLQPIVFSLAASGQLAKPVLIITITDGEPTDTPKDLVVQVIKEARNRLAAQYGPKAVAFEFAQVGKDQRAQAFLGQLDSHTEVGASIDCTSYYEMESAEYQRRGINLSPSMWLVKMMVGAIDLSHDKGDEHR